MKEILNHLLRHLDERSPEKALSKGEKEHVVFSDKRYSPIDFSADNFTEVGHDEQKARNPESDASVAYIDGGNAELLPAPDVSIQLVRLAAVLFKGDTRTTTIRREFRVFTITKCVQGKVTYSSSLFADGKDSSRIAEQTALLARAKNSSGDITYDPEEAGAMEYGQRARISKPTEILRRLGEIELAKAAVDELSKGDIILLDGTLHASHARESAALDSLYAAAEKKGVTVCALAKTTRLLTNRGNSAAYALSSIAPTKKISYYGPLAENNNAEHKAEMYFVRLHPLSKYLFRFEIHCKKDEAAGLARKIIPCLAENSKDPVFPGYPYGLLAADKEARVSKEEASSARALLLHRAAAGGKDIRGIMAALDAHDALDKISF